jgi:hypothetical protein
MKLLMVYLQKRINNYCQLLLGTMSKCYFKHQKSKGLWNLSHCPMDYNVDVNRPTNPD